MIRAIVFDVGGVLVRTQDHSHRQKWERRLGLSERESEEIVFNSEMGQKAQLGDVDDEALWNWIGMELALENDLERFRSAFWAGDVLDDELIALIRALRPHYQTAVISNATSGLRAFLAQTLRIADAFDLVVCSAEEGVMKPDPAIFERTLQRLGRRPEETVFIDDFQANVEAATKLGMESIHFRPGIDLANELARLGVVAEPEEVLTSPDH